MLTEEGDFRGAGFPIWYQDTAGLRLTLCLDGEEESFPCGWEGSPVFLDVGCTEPLYTYQDVVGFGDEAFYFKATSHPFDVPLDNGGSAQLALLLETTWFGDERFVEGSGTIGDQDIFIEAEDGTCVSAVGADLHRVEPGSELLFARIRLRVLGDQAGWYRLTYPYGVKTFYHDGVDRSQVRQQIGDFRVGEPQDFTIALNDPGAFADNPASPFIDVGGSNVTDIDQSIGFSNDAVVGFKSIGPFLVKPDYFADQDLQVADGEVLNQYVGNPIEADGGHPVVGAPYFDAQGRMNNGAGEYANYFKIEFQVGSPEVLPTDEWTIVGITDQFNVAGKVAANCAVGDNEPPVADPAPRALIGTAVNQPVTFDPFVNDLPGEEGLPIFKLITSFNDLQQGAEIIFNPGNADVSYVPAADLAYSDEFSYTLRDACGTASAPALLTVVVEDLRLNRAEYRVRTGRWLLSGSSSHLADNEISLYAGDFVADNPEANRLIGTAIVAEDRSWTFDGKATVSPAAGTVTAVSALGIVSAPAALVLR